MLFDDNNHIPEAGEGEKMCGLANFLLYRKCSDQTYNEVMIRATERRIEFSKTRQQIVGVTAVICGSKCMSDLTKTVRKEYEEEMRGQYPHLFNHSSSTISALGNVYLQNVVMEQLWSTNNSALTITEYIDLGCKSLLDDVIAQHDSSILGGSKVYYSWWQKFDAMLSKTYIQQKVSKFWKKRINQTVLGKLHEDLRGQCYKLFQIPQPSYNFANVAAAFCDTCHTIIHPRPGICIYCLYATRNPRSS